MSRVGVNTRFDKTNCILSMVDMCNVYVMLLSLFATSRVPA